MAEQVDWGKVRELLDRASRAPEWPEHYEIARAFRELDALVGKMAAALERLDRPIYDAMIARAKETRGG